MNFPPGYGIRIGIYDSRTGQITPMTGSGGAGRGGLHGHNNRGGNGGFQRGGHGGIEGRGRGFGGFSGMGAGGGFGGFPGRRIRGGMGPSMMQDISNMGGMGRGGMGGHMGGGEGRVIVNGRDIPDGMGRGQGYGWGLPVGFLRGPGFGTWTGGWRGHGRYSATRPVDPHRDFVPGGPYGTPGYNPSGTYPGEPIGAHDDACSIIPKKLRNALETVKKEDLPEDGKDCSICYTPFWEKPEAGESEAPVKLRSCGHVFGESCLNKWVQTNNSCPSCRKEFPVGGAR